MVGLFSYSMNTPMQKTELVLRSQSIMLALAFFLLLLTETTAGWSKTDSWRRHDQGVCIAREREALLSIKAGIVADPERILSSWRGQDCCRYKGVRCRSMTGHVIVLDLHGNEDGYLSGEISSSLIVLEHLQHLDLSYNLLTGPQGRLPDFIGSLHHLRYLNLSDMGFSGTVPHQLGNLSKLLYLDLSGGHNLHSEDLSWLPRLPLLKHLDLSNVNLSTVISWVDSVGMLPFLEVLRLPFCNLRNTSEFASPSNLTRLEIIDMPFNSIEKQFDNISWVWDAARLEYLNLEYSGVYGMIPAKLGQLSSLEVLMLSGNNMKGIIPDTLCSLRVLELAESHVQGDVMDFIEMLPKCSWSKLQVLRLGSNNLTGSLSDQISHLTSITTLDLSFNKLTGTLPTVIGKLPNLIYLHLRYNQMHGVVTEDHFSSLTQLQELHLSGNLFSMELKTNWIPPFSLESLGLTSCRLGPGFPQWLKSQTNISFLYMSGAGIADTMPDWFWTIFKKAASLDLSSNKIRGTLPPTLGQMNTMVLDLSSNGFTGSVPRLPQNIDALDLSENYLSGPLPLHPNSTHRMSRLFLSDNYFTGTIPASLCQMKSLEVLDIGNNRITGQLPRCSGMAPPNTASLDSDSSSSMSITTLGVNNNNLWGEFPLLVQNCPQLTFIDLGQNNFFGSIPAWIGQKLPHLKYMRLNSNMFSGHIPAQLRGLRYLQYLDLSQNNFLGTIPDSLLNMDGVTKTTELATLDNPSHTSRGLDIVDDEDQFNSYMIRSLFAVTKGQRREYIGQSIYMVSLDLSCNHLTGDIPKVIGPAAGLVNMNLSSNNLTGKIPPSIGSMHSLESLDLSSNNLFGEIPPSLANLTLLSYLNLSYNELSGRVPSGNQLGTLNPDDPASMYIGNPSLCGPPLRKSCSGNHTAESKDGSKMMTFYFGLSVGVVVGLWVVFCSLLFKKTWRVSYFWFIDEMCDKIYYLCTIIYDVLAAQMNC